jgi:hypothetical protein
MTATALLRTSMKRHITQVADGEQGEGLYFWHPFDADGHERIEFNLWGTASILAETGFVGPNFQGSIPDEFVNVPIGFFADQATVMTWTGPFTAYRPDWLDFGVNDFQRFSDGSASLQRHSGLRMSRGRAKTRGQAACMEMAPEGISLAIAMSLIAQQPLETTIAEMFFCKECAAAHAEGGFHLH